MNIIDRLMAPLVYKWDEAHGFPREWDNNYWTFTHRVMSWLRGMVS
jgi:hypothetical protein